MEDSMFANMTRLLKIAEEDEAYQAWHRSWQEFAPAFMDFANSQPEETRNVLWGYAEAGRLAYQRMMNLACTHMAFPEEDG